MIMSGFTQHQACWGTPALKREKVIGFIALSSELKGEEGKIKVI